VAGLPASVIDTAASITSRITEQVLPFGYRLVLDTDLAEVYDAIIIIFRNMILMFHLAFAILLHKSLVSFTRGWPLLSYSLMQQKIPLVIPAGNG
jgi:hypothetical protein